MAQKFCDFSYNSHRHAVIKAVSQLPDCLGTVWKSLIKEKSGKITEIIYYPTKDAWFDRTKIPSQKPEIAQVLSNGIMEVKR